METINLGRVAFVYKGDYSALTTYNKMDVVFDGESSFVSQIDNNVGNALVNGLKWKYLSRGNNLELQEAKQDIVALETDLNQLKILTKYATQWYGIEWDTAISSSACIRIGNTSLHSLLPIQSKMRRCALLDTGIVNYYLHPTDSTKKEDGTSAILDGSDGQIMVEIPEFYYEFQTEGTKNRVLMSLYPIFPKKSNRMYVSAYEATVQRSANKLASVVNLTADYRGGNNNSAYDSDSRTFLGKPATYLTLPNFRTFARNRGSVNWNCNTYTVHKAIFWLSVVEYANFNCQLPYNAQPTTDGYKQGGMSDGVSTLNLAKWNAFNGASPVIPCGHTNSLGNSTGIVQYSMPNEYDVLTFNVDVPSYRGIENPFGHIFKWADGCKCELQADVAGGLSKFYTCANPSSYQSANYVGYEVRGLLPRANGYIRSMLIGDFGEVMPSSIGGTSIDYMCDWFWTGVPSTGVATMGVLFGGSASDGTACGLTYSRTNHPDIASAPNFGSRLCYLT